MPVMAIAFYTLTYNSSLHADNAYKPVEKVANIIVMQDKPDTGTPADFDVLTNIAIANQILYTANYFEGSSYGEVKASIATQKVYNKRKVKDGDVFMQSVSTSPFVKIADQKYVSGGTYLYRDGSNIKGDTADFGEVKEMSENGYLQKYGIVPREIAKYVIDETTVLSAVVESFPASGTGDYVFRLELDPALSTVYYANEVRTLSGATAQYPQFESVSVTVTMDSDWIVKSFSVDETYVIDKPFKVTCTASLTETFSDIGAGLDIPEAEPFLAYVPTGDVDDGEAEDSPVLFLGEAFGPYLNGEPLYLSASVRVPAYGLDLGLTADIDLSAMRFDFLIDDELYISYRQNGTTGTADAAGEPAADDAGRIYFKAGGIEGHIPVAAFTDILPVLVDALPSLSPKLAELLEGLDIEALGDVGTLLSGAELIRGEEISTVKLPIALGDITLDAEIKAYNAGGLHSVHAGAGLFNLAADIEALPLSEKPAMPENTESYPDLTYITDILVPLVNTLGGRHFALGLTADVTVGGTTFNIAGDAAVDLDGGTADASVTLSDGAGALDARLTYAGGALYLSAGNLAVKATTEEIAALIARFTGIDPAAADLSGFDLSAILSHVLGVSGDGSALSLRFDGASVTIETDGSTITAVSVSTSDLGGVRAAARADIRLTDATPAVTVPDNAVSLSCALALYDAAAAFADGFTLAGTAEAEYLGLAAPVRESVGFTAVYDGRGGFAVEAEAATAGIRAAAVRTADGMLYLSAAGFQLKYDTTRGLPAFLSGAAGDAASGGILSVAGQLLGAVQSLTLSDGALHLTAALGGYTLDIRAAYGEKIESLSLSCTGEALSVAADAAFTAGGATVTAPAGNYAEVHDTAAGTVAALLDGRRLAFDLSADIAAGGFTDTATITGAAAFSQDGITAEAEATLSGTGVSAHVLFAGDTLYLSSGAVAAKATVGELEALIRRFASDTAGAGFDAAALVGRLNRIDITDGAVSLTFTAGTVSVRFADGALSGIGIGNFRAETGGFAVSVAGETDVTQGVVSVSVPDNAVSLSDALALYDAAAAVLEARGFRLGGTADIAFGKVADTLSFTVDIGADRSFALAFSLVKAGLSGSVTRTADGGLWVTVGDFRLHTAAQAERDETAAGTELPAFVTDLLPPEAVYLIENGLSDANGAARNIAGLLKYVRALSLDGDGVRLEVKTDALSLALSLSAKDTIAAEVSLAAALNGYPVSLNVTAALSASSAAVAPPEGTFAEISGDVKALLTALLEGKTFAADLALSATAPLTDGETAEIDVTGRLKVSVYGGQAAFALSLDAFGTPVSVRSAGGVYYLGVGSLQLKLNHADEAAFIAALDENLPAFIGDFVQKLLALDIAGLTGGGSAALSVDDIVSGLGVTDDGRITLALDTGAALIEIGFPYPSGGVLAGAAVTVRTGDGALVEVTLDAPVLGDCTSLTAESGAPLYAPADADAYVDIMEFAAYLSAIRATVTASGFELTLTEDLVLTVPGTTYLVSDDMAAGSSTPVYDEYGEPVTAPVTRTVTIAAHSDATPGVIRIVPQGEIGKSGWFVSVFADLTVTRTQEVIGVDRIIQQRTLTQRISAALVDEAGVKVIYADYDGMKIRMRFDEALGTLAYVRDILGITGTILDDIPEDCYDASLDTSVFDDMSVAGLESLRATITDLLVRAEAVFNVLFGYEADESAGLTGYTGALEALGSITQAADLNELMDIVTAFTDALDENGLGSDAASGDIIATVQSVLQTIGSLRLSFADDTLSVALPADTGTADIALSHADGYLSALSVTGLSAGGVTVNGALALSTQNVSVTPPDNAATFDATDSTEERAYYSDFSSINSLFEDLINTANLKAFHIGGADNAEKGTIRMTIPEVIGIPSSIGIDIPFVAKIQLEADENGVYKPLVYVRLEVPSFPLAVDECISSLYYYDDTLLFTRTMTETQLSTPDWNDTTYWTKTEYVKVTTEELLKKDAYGQLDIGNIMKYVYFMIPLSSIVQSPINKAIENGITKDFAETQEILNYYAFRDGSYRLGIDVAEISRIAEINDANVTITTAARSDGKRYLDRLQADITFLYGTSGIAQGIKLTVDGYLVNPGERVGNITYYDPTRPDNDCPASLSGWQIKTHYHRDGVYTEDISVIPAMLDKIAGGGTISGAGTIDSPYSQYSCNSSR